MNRLKSIIRFIKNPLRLIRPLGARGIFNGISDGTYLKLVL